MRTLLAAIILVASVFPARAELVDLELILAVDVSGSVDDEEAQLQRDGYVAAIRSDKFIRAIQSGRRGRIALAYVEWAGEHAKNTVVDWTLIDSAPTAQGFADDLSEAPLRVELWTSISGAVDFALENDNSRSGFLSATTSCEIRIGIAMDVSYLAIRK